MYLLSANRPMGVAPNFLKAPPPAHKNCFYTSENPDFQAPAAGSGQMGVPLFGRLISTALLWGWPSEISKGFVARQQNLRLYICIHPTRGSAGGLGTKGVSIL